MTEEHGHPWSGRQREFLTITRKLMRRRGRTKYEEDTQPTPPDYSAKSLSVFLWRRQRQDWSLLSGRTVVA